MSNGFDVDKPLKQLVNPNNIVDQIERNKYSLPAGASQYVNNIDQLSKTLGEQTVGTITLQGEANMSADLVNIDWWLPLGLANDESETVYSIAYDGIEYVYFGGQFSQMGGVRANNIVKYSVVTRNWSEVAGGVDAVVNKVYIDSTGGVYIGGSFTAAGGDTNADGLAQLSGSTWASVVNFSGLGAVYDLVKDSTGGLYVGGGFTNAGGNANADYIFKWDGALSSLSTGLSAQVKVIKINPVNGNLYIGGEFINAGGNANADYLAIWNGTSFSSLSTFALNGYVLGIAFDVDGTLYVTGNFTSANSNNSANCIFKWDGNSVIALGNGITTGNGNVVVVSFNHEVYVGGNFSSINDLDNTDDIAVFRGGVWQSVSKSGGFDAGLVYDILLLDSGSIIAGGGFINAGSIQINSNVAIMCHPLSEAMDVVASLFELYSSNLDDTKGWKLFTNTCTYASAQTFTVKGACTDIFTRDTRIKFDNPTTKYGVVISSSYASPNTTVTILTNADYTVANSAITNVYISYEASPAGYPRYFNFTPSWSNVTVGNGTSRGEVSINEGWCKGWASLEWLPTSDTPTSAVTGQIGLNYPAPPSTNYTLSNINEVGGGTVLDASPATIYKMVAIDRTGILQLRSLRSDGTRVTEEATSGTVPITWAGDDKFVIEFNYPYY